MIKDSMASRVVILDAKNSRDLKASPRMLRYASHCLVSGVHMGRSTC